MFLKTLSGKSWLSVIFILTALVSSPVIVWGGTLIGDVTNASDGQALLAAKIVIISNDLSFEYESSTDRTGRFEITGISQGDYAATITCSGFVAFEIANIEITDSDTTIINASLEHSIITLDAVLVTASRRPEKMLEAPASVSIIESENIEARTTITPSEHVKGLAAVDVATTGLSQSNVVVRGFNNIFSGILLVLHDNRLARVPSLRLNSYTLIPASNEDIERIEIVSGPGSALYGPNCADGIMHIITKSPFSSEGTTISLGGGERDLYFGSFRHARSIKNRVGFKISGQYYKGRDWESFDPYEPDSIRLFRPTAAGPEYVGEFKINQREFDSEKISGEARADFIINEDMLLIVNGGFTRASGIELTQLGASQVIDWTYYFSQVRLMYKDLFAQCFVNASDAGDTYSLRSGQLIVDKSKVWAGQIQHRYTPAEMLSFTYGFDALLTRPNTESTINGRNENKDNINEFGLYLQSEAKLSKHLKFTGAARIDNHTRIKRPIFSPRTAIAYQPDQNNNFRLTYNRAYGTPHNNSLYLDILQAEDPFGVGSGFEQSLGFRPDIDIRAQGVPETGFHWRVNENGPQFRSPFAPLDPRGLETRDFIDLNDPIFTNVMWGAGRGAVISGFADSLSGMGVPQENIDALLGSLLAVTPTTVSGVNNVLRIFNRDTRSFDSFNPEDISDIDPMKPTYTNTIEFGYKGVLAERLRFSFDAYRTEKNDFVGAMVIETPNVFLDPATLSSYLEQAFAELLNDPDNADYAVTLAALDDPALGGNGNGTPVDELTDIFVYGASQIPFGTVSPQEALDPEAVLFTYRNFGDIVFYGIDFALACRLSQNWSIGGSFSYISKNLFEKSTDQLHDIYLNVPKHKFGLFLRYINTKTGLTGDSRLRFIDSFEMYGPFIGTTVKSYTVVDLNLGYRLPYNSKLTLTVQNLFDNKHIEFVGAPRIGRLAILRISHSF